MAASPEKYDDIDKRYFCGWHRNPAGKSVREKNRNKSLLYFPAKEVEMRKKLNMSSCWSANPDDEVLIALNQLVADEDIPSRTSIEFIMLAYFFVNGIYRFYFTLNPFKRIEC